MHYVTLPCFSLVFFFLMIRPPPRSTLFPSRRSSDLPPSVFDAAAPSATMSSLAPEPRSGDQADPIVPRNFRHTLVCGGRSGPDRKSTRLNSSHVKISYAVFCLKKKNNERCIPFQSTD